jgi:hypothetical protein
MKDFLAKIEAKLQQLRDLKALHPDKYRYLHAIDKLRERCPPGYCPSCNLPKGVKHVAHDLLNKRPQSEMPENWRFINQAFKEVYGAALKNLTDDELLGMSLPVQIRSLYVIHDEVRDRIAQVPQVTRRSVWERLGEDENEAPMLEVQLVTSDGGFVGNFQIPPLQKLPEVIIWGSRVFHLDEPDKTPLYREVFAYTIVTDPVT